MRLLALAAIVPACGSVMGSATAQPVIDHAALIKAAETHLGAHADLTAGLAEAGQLARISAQPEMAALPYGIFEDEIMQTPSCLVGELDDEVLRDSLRAYHYSQSILPRKELSLLETKRTPGNLVLFFAEPLGNMVRADLFPTRSSDAPYADYADSEPGLTLLFCLDTNGTIAATFARDNGNSR